MSISLVLLTAIALVTVIIWPNWRNSFFQTELMIRLLWISWSWITSFIIISIVISSVKCGASFVLDPSAGDGCCTNCSIIPKFGKKNALDFSTNWFVLLYAKNKSYNFIMIEIMLKSTYLYIKKQKFDKDFKCVHRLINA